MPFRAPPVRHTPLFASLLLGLVVTPVSHAASFNLTGAGTSAQTLSTGQTGTVAAGASLTVSGGTTAVTVSGNNATLTNLGTISQTGTGRAVRDNTGVTNLKIVNGSATNSTATIQTQTGDVVQMNATPASVTLDNYGRMISTNSGGGGNQVVDFNALQSGANIVNNHAGALMQATAADTVRPGLNGVVNNWGTIQSFANGTSSDAIDLQSNSGVSIYNYGTGLVDGGRHGITGGADGTFTLLVNNAAGGIIRGSDGAGLNLDGGAGQLITVVNHGTITGNGLSGDGDGVDVDGLVNLTNTGTIRSINSFSAVASGLAYSEGLSVGGGTILNSGVIEGLVAAGNTNAVGRGISLVGNDITSGIHKGQRESLYGNASVTNQKGGLIRGESDSAIYAGGLTGSGKTVSIQNDAGATIRGGGTTSAAIVVASDYATTVHNAGLIDGSSSGKAIQLGSGQNTVTLAGGEAEVRGSIDGGSGGHNTLNLQPGNGQQFSYDGAISNFEQVTVGAGTTVLSGVSSYTGTTTVEAGGTLVLDGANRLASGSALALAGGTLRLQNVANTAAQTFSTLAISADSAIDIGGGWLTFGGLGSVVSGSKLLVTGHDLASLYTLRFAGDLSANSTFLGLMSNTTIDGLAVRYTFDGAFTNVSAVPEPGSVLMMLAGLGIVGAVGRRRKQRQPADALTQ